MTEDQNHHLEGRVKAPFTQSEMGSESPSWSVFSERDYWQGVAGEVGDPWGPGWVEVSARRLSVGKGESGNHLAPGLHTCGLLAGYHQLACEARH